MKTTLELQKLILENLHILEHIWNISVVKDLSSVSFEYVTWANPELVRRNCMNLGITS